MKPALGFLTIFGSASVPTGHTLRWFGLVGALIGALVGAVWHVAAEAFNPLVAAGLVVSVDLVVTGFLHLDGLADSGDGLIAPMSPQRRLAVMRTPDVGAFGLGAVVLVLGLRWAALASTEPVWWLVAMLWALSRIFVAAVPAFVDYAREEGLVTSFLGDEVAAWLPLLALPAMALAFAFDGIAPAAAIFGGFVGTVCVVAVARSRIGGFTGDVLGAAILVSETVGLVVYSANW